MGHRTRTRKRYRPGTPSATMLALGLAMGPLGNGVAQVPKTAAPPVNPATPATPGASASTEELPAAEYDTSYVPFMDRPWSRIHDPEAIPAVPELFQRYDPAKGLAKQAQTSRVALTGFRAEVFAPVKDVRAGDIVEIPISVRNGPPLTALRVFLEYDPAILKPLGALGVGIPTEEIGFNAEMDPKEVPNAARTVAALNVLGRPWTKNGQILRLTFQALKEGESPLRASLSEISNANFELVPNVFRSGLVRVRPRS